MLDPVIGGALITSGLGGISKLLGSSSQNKANLQIAREQMAWQTKEREAQNQWNLEQWNRENEYNNATNQRARLEDAGLNPYIMLDGGNAGTASSITSASTPSAPNMPTQQNVFDGFGDTLADVASMLYEKKYKDATANMQDSQASLNETLKGYNEALKLYTEGKNRREESANFYDTWLKDNQAKLAFEQTSTERENRKRIQADIDLKWWQTYAAALNAEAQGILNKYLDKRQQMDLTEKLSQINLLKAQKIVSEKQAELLTQQAIKTATEGQISLENLNLLQKTLSGAIEVANAKNQFDADNYNFENAQNHKYNYKYIEDNNRTRYVLNYGNPLNRQAEGILQLPSHLQPLAASGLYFGNQFNEDMKDSARQIKDGLIKSFTGNLFNDWHPSSSASKKFYPSPQMPPSSPSYGTQPSYSDVWY